MMELNNIRDMLAQVQTGARVTTAIGEPVTVGNRVIIPVAEIAYGGGGGGGAGKAPTQETAEGAGGGGGLGVRIRPLGCWVFGPDGADRWMPALDMNRIIMLGGAITVLMLMTVKALLKHR